ncbi:MAG: zinc-binding alcohol dehydrogenase family protein [Aquisalimonadaceae bacterium]
MKAIGLRKYLPVDNEDCLVDVEVNKPVAEGLDLLVRVRAVSVNPVDTKVRSLGEGTEDPPRILGWDASGEVVAVGSACSRYSVGDEVFYAGSMTRPGSNSEYQLVDERIVGARPKSLTHEQSAALPLTSLTAWESLFERMNLTPEPSAGNAGARLLIIAGAGGVGSIATQLAKRVAAVGTVITTASRPETRDWCLKMGADSVIDHSRPLRDQLEALDLAHVDYILCCSQPDGYFAQMADLIAPQGSICSIVKSAGDAPLPMNDLMAKSVRYCWEYMFTRSMFQTDDMDAQGGILDRISHLVDNRTISTTMTENLGPMTARNVIEGHRRLEEGRVIGKLVLSGI